MLLIKQINAIYETQLFKICLLMSMLMFYAKKVKALNMFTNLETKRTVNCLNMPLPRATTFLRPKMDKNVAMVMQF